MTTSITSESAGALERLIWSFLNCQAFTAKLYNPYFYINKDTADSGLYHIFASETKHTVMVQSLACYKSRNGNHLCLISSSKTNGPTSLNAPSKRHVWNAAESRKKNSLPWTISKDIWTMQLLLFFFCCPLTAQPLVLYWIFPLWRCNRNNSLYFEVILDQ